MVLDRGRKPDSVCKHVLFDLHSNLKHIEPIFKNKKIAVKIRLLASLEKFKNSATSMVRGGSMLFRQC